MRKQGPQTHTAFVRAGERTKKTATIKKASCLEMACDWEMRVDLDKQLVIPAEIVTTTLRPDLILWSVSTKTFYIIELTVPWEGAVDEAYERKSLKYAELAAQAEQNGSPPG